MLGIKTELVGACLQAADAAACVVIACGPQTGGLKAIIHGCHGDAAGKEIIADGVGGVGAAAEAVDIDHAGPALGLICAAVGQHDVHE